MRSFEERKAEVFRRSENRIKERKRNRNRILTLCIPLCLMLTVWSVGTLPSLFAEKSNDANCEGNGNIYGDTVPESVGGFIEESKMDASPIKYDAQYIRTDGYHEGTEYPDVKIIRSVDELNAYYNANKNKFDLERKDKVYADTTIGFLDACDKYDEAYFQKQILVMVLLEEGSGSNRHNVDSVKVSSEGILYVNISSIVPEVGTCDMAQWHILIEPEAGVDVASESNVEVYLDGINPKKQPTTVREEGSFSSITLTIPYDWEYEIERGNNADEYCIAFWPEDQTEGKIKMWYYTMFGVCGTGLETEEIIIGGYKARKGTYHNKKTWDFIHFVDMQGYYVAMNDGAEKWWSEYGEEAMQILSTVKIAEDILTEENIDVESGE